MTIEQFEIKAYNDIYKEQVISVWEQSVRATHTFLTTPDFEKIKELVKAIDFTSLPVFCLMHHNSVAGFIGVSDKKVEMLFLSPRYLGKGLGKKLMRFAINDLNANEVDVNEQNQNAVAFYKKMGFENYARTEKDGLGKNYPILKMKLNNTDE